MDTKIPSFTTTFHMPDGSEVVVPYGGKATTRRLTYDADYLKIWGKVADFLKDRRFVAAYKQGMDSGHRIGRKPGSSDDIHIEFRVHTICWAASLAAKLEGDFVECGVNTGIYSLALCHYLDFNRLDKNFYLFDTYSGIPVEQASNHDGESAELLRYRNESAYVECYERAKANFAPFPRAKLVRGKVPETLSSVDISTVCYLSLDMNVAYAERKAIEYFWPKLARGAPVVLDDYAWASHEAQKRALDEFAQAAGVEILTLPTGQGLMIKV